MTVETNPEGLGFQNGACGFAFAKLQAVTSFGEHRLGSLARKPAV